MSNEIPRRVRMDLWIPAERAINDALQAVEALGAHPDLTAVVIKLSDAQRDIADWYDGGAPGACTGVETTTCQFHEEAQACFWSGCPNKEPTSPSTCPLPWPRAEVKTEESQS